MYFLLVLKPGLRGRLYVDDVAGRNHFGCGDIILVLVNGHVQAL